MRKKGALNESIGNGRTRSPSLLRNEAKRSIPRTAGHGSMEMNFTFGRVWFCVLRCVGHGYRAVRFPTGRPPTRRARTKTLSRERDSFDRCGSFTGNRVSHAPFFVTKRKATMLCTCTYTRIHRRRRTFSKIWLVSRRPPELLGYPVTVPRPTSVLQYTCRYSLAGHSHRTNKCAARCAPRLFRMMRRFGLKFR